MELDAIVTDPAGVEAWRLSDDAVLNLLPELSERMRQLDALRVRLAHEVHERCLNKKVGGASTADWLSGACRLTPGHARKLVAAAHSVRHRPDVADAMTSGTTDVDQVRAITNLLDQIPDLLRGTEPELVEECTRQCTDYLVAAAEHEHAGETTRRAAALRTMLERDQDGPAPDDENPALNEFHVTQMPGGRVRLKGTFDKITGEQFMTAVSSLSKPTPGRNNATGELEPDPRSPAQRRADAVADIVRFYLDSGAAPREGGERPHMTVFVDLRDLENATRNTNATSQNPVTQQSVQSSFLRRGPSWMPWLGPITVATAGTVSCDASITPIVMDEDGNPLDVGHTTRVIPKRIRKALEARDCGCAFPNCGRPTAWTDGHHIHHWSNGGPTALNNLVLLCRHHHTLIHKNDWQVVISTDDGHPWFIPPRWVDPDRQPIPAHNRQRLAFTG
ncbi:HNH endonuclease signature motif containing protein [Rhodococcus gannanensis]|uniref:DUF222 domain-containing protein n=1 Tax=Rhodococcus gannanensis TaxID=1960308 RepID=A0ABW4P9U3_9NOCA